MLQHVVSLVEQRYRKKGQDSLFEALRFVIAPGSEEPRSYAEIAQAEGMSESAVKVAAHRLRERFGKQLRKTIADTVLEQDEVEAEIRELMGAFG